MLYGIDIGGTKIELAVFDEQLNKLSAERVPTPKTSYEDWLSAIAQLVKNADETYQCKGKVGIGVPGFINQQTGIAYITNIPAASGQRILADLSERLGRPVRGENDANCFALSEAMAEDNRQYHSVLGLILGTGFGGGLILNGNVYAGRNGMAGELGHIQLNFHALKLLGWNNAPIYDCDCGNKACLDTYLSGRGFEFLYRDLCGESLSAPVIIERFYAGDEEVVAFVEMFVKVCATAIANISTMLDPDLIVLGGGLSNFEYLYQALPKALPQYLMKNAPVPVIKKAQFGDAGGTRGAAALWLIK